MVILCFLLGGFKVVFSLGLRREKWGELNGFGGGDMGWCLLLGWLFSSIGMSSCVVLTLFF